MSGELSIVGITVIMPVYNGESTISYAINSILRQKCSYPIEIIVVDDASTDNTVSIVEGYRDKCNIRLIRNHVNLGNSGAFYNGLKHVRSKYWTVLDADDYYSNENKLQTQIDFLENDVNEEYVGVAHNFVLDYGKGKVDIPTLSEITEFDYDDFIIGRIVYCHTATYVYRNIFNGEPPNYLSEKNYRGDTIRTGVVLKLSRKKIKVLPIVASVYNKNGQGIWSGMSSSKKLKQQLRVLGALKSIADDPYERAGYNLLMLRDNILFRLCKSVNSKTIYELVASINENINANGNNLESTYWYSRYYDTAIESIAYSVSMFRPSNEYAGSVSIFVSESNGNVTEKINAIITSNPQSKITIFKFGNFNLEIQQVSDIITIVNQKTMDEALDRHFGQISDKSFFICGRTNYLPFLFVSKETNNQIILLKENIFVSGMTNPFIDTIIRSNGQIIKNARKDQCSIESMDLIDCKVESTMTKIKSSMKSIVYSIIERMIRI